MYGITLWVGDMRGDGGARQVAVYKRFHETCTVEYLLTFCRPPAEMIA
jgi:hypothetical protein